MQAAIDHGELPKRESRRSEYDKAPALASLDFPVGFSVKGVPDESLFRGQGERRSSSA